MKSVKWGRMGAMMPLLILIVAEALWGMVAGLWLAVAWGLGELLYYGLRHRRLEKSSLWDMGLLLVLGLVALALEGPLLERLRPLIYLSLLLLMVGLSAFSKHNLMLAATGRFMKVNPIGPWAAYLMRASLQRMFVWMAVYTLLLVAALLYGPPAEGWTASWGWLPFLLGFFVAEQLLKRRQQGRWRKEEWLPLVAADGKILDAAPRSMVHRGKERWLHPVVHVQLLRQGGLWLQKRPAHKLVQPGKWDTAVGGHVAAGESLEKSLQRETSEEIGVALAEVQHLGRYEWQSELERELVYTFVLKHEGPLRPHPEELDGGRVWSFDEIEAQLGKDVFTPNFEYEYQRYRTVLRA